MHFKECAKSTEQGHKKEFVESEEHFQGKWISVECVYEHYMNTALQATTSMLKLFGSTLEFWDNGFQNEEGQNMRCDEKTNGDCFE